LLEAGFCPLHIRVAVYWAALRLPVQEVPSSYLHPEAGYPERYFVVSLPPSKKMLTN
jgi:hypothetical protein